MYRILFVMAVLWAVFILPAFAVSSMANDQWEQPAGYVTVIDETGSVIFKTGLEVSPGDQFLNENNRLYEIITVEGSLAKARFLHEEPLTMAIPAEETVPVQASATAPLPLIAIYHTHNDESYTPTDGHSTISGNGGIMLVGDAFAQRLTALGYQVEHDKTIHEPHDANAYHRSRRTFLKLLEHQPAALFDLHRDSAPLEVYQATINGQAAAKILLVVGRQNQNRNTVYNYARKIKQASDAKYPGLIRGIFMAHGNYNQDLNPKAMLLEIGTQYNTRQAAERSVTLFADIVPVFLQTAARNAASPLPALPFIPQEPETADTTTVYTKDIASIAAVLIAGITVYLYLSTGSWQEAKTKLKKFSRYEFTNFLGSRRKRKD